MGVKTIARKKRADRSAWGVSAGASLPGAAFGPRAAARRRARGARGGRGGRGERGGARGGGGGHVYGRENLRRVLTGRSVTADGREAFFGSLRPTCDPFDRAHNDRGPGGDYLPQSADGRVPRAGLRARAPRLYHPSQLVGPPGREVGIDSSFDATARLAAWLRAETGYDPARTYRAPDWAALARSVGGSERLRSMLGEDRAFDPEEAEQESLVREFFARRAARPAT